MPVELEIMPIPSILSAIFKNVRHVHDHSMLGWLGFGLIQYKSFITFCTNLLGLIFHNPSVNTENNNLHAMLG